MSGGEIKMLATVSESTYTRLYRELAALPERKRVKRLIVLAQIGQIAEMAAMGHQLLPAPDLSSPTATTAAPPSAAVASKPAEPSPRIESQVSPSPNPDSPIEPAPQASIPAVYGSPGLEENSKEGSPEEIHVDAQKAQAPIAPAVSKDSPPLDQPTTLRKPRRSGHGFKVSM